MELLEQCVLKYHSCTKWDKTILLYTYCRSLYESVLLSLNIPEIQYVCAAWRSAYWVSSVSVIIE